jgi:hypothetical protein
MMAGGVAALRAIMDIGARALTEKASIVAKWVPSIRMRRED